MRTLLVVLVLGTVTLQSLAQRRPPNYSQNEMPLTSFTCRDKIIGGYYADPETDCQMFHVCAKVAGGVQDFRFLCPNDTSFDQENQICDDWYNIDCESHLLYNDNFDLYRLGAESNRVVKPAKATPIPLGPTSVKPIPAFTRQKQFQGGNSIDEDDNFLRSDTGDKRLHNDLLRGSSSSNFYSNRNGKDDYVDNEPIISSREQDVSKVSNDIEKKNKNKAVVRKLLTGKRPLGLAANAVNNEPSVEYTTKYQNFYRNKQTNSYSSAVTTTTPPSTTYSAPPTESTTLYVRPKNSNLRFRGSISFGSTKSADKTATNNAATATEPTVDYYKKSSAKPSYNKNNFNANTQTQQTFSTAQQQNYNTNQQANYNTNQQQNYNGNQQQIYNSNQQQNYNRNQQQNFNANTNAQAQIAFTNENQQVYNANNQAISANQQFYDANQQYNTNQRNLVKGINQQAYNVNNLQSTSVTNQNAFTTQQQNYNTQQYNNGPTQVPLDYFKKTSVKQVSSKQASAASQSYNTQAQKETTANYNEFYRTSTLAPSTTFNYNEYYRTSTNEPSTAINYNEFYRTSTNSPTTQFNYNEFYRTSTSAPNNNYNEFYKTSTTGPSTTFDYNEYYRTSAAALPSSTANYYDPYNSYKEKFLANNAYEEDVQDEFLKTAPSNNLRPSDINAFSKAYVKPVSFNASLTAKLNYNSKGETTVKPTKEKTVAPTQQTYYTAKQNVQSSAAQSVTQQKQTTNQQTYYTPKQNTHTTSAQTVTQQKSSSNQPKTAETPVAPQVQQSVQTQTAKTPTLTLEEYKKILEKPSDYDYAYYDGGDPNRDYDGVERIPEEFSKTKNIKKA